MTTVNIYNMAQAWNNGAVDFTAIKMNVTDTASGSNSLLLDLQVGGTSQAKVSKDGNLTLGGHIYLPNSQSIITGSARIVFSSFGRISNEGFQCDVANQSYKITNDCVLRRDAADTWAMQRSTNPQAFNIYNTYTDGSNYERGCVKWSSNTLIIGTENAGTGTKRAIRLNNVGFINGSGDSDQGIGLSAAGYMSWTDNAGTEKWRFGVNIEAHPSFGITWANSSSIGGTKDLGLTRSSAGILKVTNGSTGYGELIFIVPTSDPAVAGALWNNAGTLTISAG